jgi:two-component system, OmpR family, response regulator ResD
MFRHIKALQRKSIFPLDIRNVLGNLIIALEDNKPEDYHMPKLKILLAEDDRKIRKLHDHYLKEEVFEKRFALDGEEALAIYSEWDPDIIVLDIMMPAVTGYTVLKTIREEQNDMSRCIVMSTSLSSKSDILDCIRIGISGYLLKPLKWKELPFSLLDFYQKANPKKADMVAEFKHILTELQKARASESQQLKLDFGKPLTQA